MFEPHYYLCSQKRSCIWWRAEGKEKYEMRVSGWWQWKVREWFLVGAMLLCLYASWISDAYVFIQRQNQHQQPHHFSHSFTWTTSKVFMDGEFHPLILILKSFMLPLTIIISKIVYMCTFLAFLWCKLVFMLSLLLSVIFWCWKFHFDQR